MNFDVIDKKHRKKVSSDTGLFSFGTWVELGDVHQKFHFLIKGADP